MVRRLISALFLLVATFTVAVAQQLDFKQADFLCRRGEGSDYTDCVKLLEAMLPDAASGHQKAEVLWRLSKMSVILGQAEKSDSGKRQVFGQGIKYAEEAIREDPKNPQCYMWHCANIGRECQTHNLMEQAASVKPMMADLTMILDKLGHKECSEAWQALAEIYYNHPFKSNDDAIKFATNAVNNIPKDELRLSTYSFLAKMLWERNNSARKRGSDISDREEAAQLVTKAMKLYENSTSLTSVDKADYKDLVALHSTMK